MIEVVFSGHDEQNPVLLATVNLTQLKQKSDKSRMWSKLVLMKGSQQIVADMTKGKQKRWAAHYL